MIDKDKKVMSYTISKACEIINRHNFKTITLQFPDEVANLCTDIYDQFIQLLGNDEISIFIAADSTYGSSIDDISALHVDSDVLVYFGSDLSSSGSIPVILLPALRSFDITSCLDRINTALDISDDVSSSNNVLLFYEPCYTQSVRDLYASLLNIYPNISTTITLASLPPFADLDNWDASKPNTTLTNDSITASTSANANNYTLVGGLLCDKALVDTPDTIVLYIGDKQEQLINIYLHMSSNKVITYSPYTDTIDTKPRGDNTREFTQRTGGIL